MVWEAIESRPLNTNFDVVLDVVQVANGVVSYLRPGLLGVVVKCAWGDTIIYQIAYFALLWRAC